MSVGALGHGVLFLLRVPSLAMPLVFSSRPGVTQQNLCLCMVVVSSVWRLPPWGLNIRVCWVFLPYTFKFKELPSAAERPGGLGGA